MLKKISLMVFFKKAYELKCKKSQQGWGWTACTPMVEMCLLARILPLQTHEIKSAWVVLPTSIAAQDFWISSDPAWIPKRLNNSHPVQHSFFLRPKHCQVFSKQSQSSIQVMKRNALMPFNWYLGTKSNWNCVHDPSVITWEGRFNGVA